MKQPAARLILEFLIVFLAVFSALRSTMGPSVLPENAPIDKFSALRALSHVEAIARNPHPVGSLGHEEVRCYLIKEIKSLGLTPEVQSTVVVRPWWGSSAASLINVMVRLKGREEGKAVLFVSHYDSAPPVEGIQLDVELAGRESLNVETIGQIFALPDFKNSFYKPRPPQMMPEYSMGRVSDSTLIHSVTTLRPNPIGKDLK